MKGLQINHYRVGYRNNPVLSDFSLPRIAPGSLVALVGANGSGKSTLLRSIAGLQPSAGKATFDGEDISRLPLRQLTKKVAYLPQALPQGNSLVAYESVLSANRALSDDAPIEELNQRIGAVFHDLDLMDLAMRRLNQLSGGQRQMIGLAQILVRKPRLLLLDEPTSALDLRWQLKVLEAVQTICRKEQIISIIAIHDINLALRFCSELVVLGHNGLEAAGKPADILDSELLRRTYGIEGRVESCSLGSPIILADRALSPKTPESAG